MLDAGCKILDTGFNLLKIHDTAKAYGGVSFKAGRYPQQMLSVVELARSALHIPPTG